MTDIHPSNEEIVVTDVSEGKSRQLAQDDDGQKFQTMNNDIESK